MLVDNPSLLITDDDRDFRETLREVFERRGYRTLLAEDGEQAVHILLRESIHVAVLDMHMPRLDGLGAVQLARESRIDIPFILLSAALDDRLVAAARQVNIFASLAKPVSFSDITRIVRDALRARGLTN
jgi:two-component system chemotaxis response regulator CheY